MLPTLPPLYVCLVFVVVCRDADEDELDIHRRMNDRLIDTSYGPSQQRLRERMGLQPATDVQQQQERAATAAPPTPPGATYMHTQPRSRPEYALFLASMAWLHHDPERQQYKQQLYACFDFNAMRDNELSQVRWGMHAGGLSGVWGESVCLGLVGCLGCAEGRQMTA